MAAKKKAKQVDPISERARALNEQISSLEAEIKKIDSQLQRPPAPKFKSTAIPHGATVSRKPEPAPAPKPKPTEPVFEEIKKSAPTAEPGSPEHYNELGVRKYDLPALWKRIRNHFRSPTTSNPRLVNYLAAGGVQGLRPLRYEKRVARNRLFALIIFLMVVLLGIISLVVKYHH
ncbi:MAG TPA: hypothetical protein VE344_10905 [Methylomirabilota bacterium]|nr:hypothetical protein [Methylomirabilota bacterium]